MVLKAQTSTEQPGEIEKYLDRFGWYQTEFDGQVPVLIRLAVRTQYGQLRFLVLPALAWVPAERVAPDYDRGEAVLYLLSLGGSDA